MRLWHESLIPLLPRLRILGRHSEICGMRGAGWGKKHAVVDYAFTHPYADLFHFHTKVMAEMQRRGYNVAKQWLDQSYRGQVVGYDYSAFTQGAGKRYGEHDEAYLAECVANLADKGIILEVA